MRPTLSYIAEHAANRPNALAVVVAGRQFTFEVFCKDIRVMVSALMRLNVPAGRAVAVEQTNPYLHWLMLLAFEALGVATVSFTKTDTALLEELPDIVDLVLCVGAVPANIQKPVKVIDETWGQALKQLPANESAEQNRLAGDAPIRVLRTSGTTGIRRWMVHTVQVFNGRVGLYAQHAGYSPDSRFLMVLGFQMQAFHAHLTGCIRAGGICVFEPGAPVPVAVQRYGITNLVLLPYQLTALLDELPPQYAKSEALKVRTNGASISSAIRNRALAAFCGRLDDCYGSNETGPVCADVGGEFAEITPGVTVEAVNDDGEPVTGTPGILRIKSPANIDGYVNDADATQHMFRDGWFYPGDAGIVYDGGRMRVLGRADDLLNLGGIKTAPEELEAECRAKLPVADICVVNVPRDDGTTGVCVAVAPGPATPVDNLEQTIRPLLGPLLRDAGIVTVASIPRTENGKIRRNEVRDAIKNSILH